MNNTELIKQMRGIVKKTMKAFQSDFDDYDEPYIAAATPDKFPMVWIVGESHTYLLKLQEYREAFISNEAVRYSYVQNDDSFSYIFDSLDKGDRIFVLSKESAVEVPIDTARGLVEATVEAAVTRWEKENGPLPENRKVEVRFKNCPPSILKKLVRECEEHGDASLLSALRRFQHYRRVSDRHTVVVTYHPSYNDFTFCEYIGGEPRINGGIVFHGWPETGYEYNDAYQLTPTYGWSVHT